MPRPTSAAPFTDWLRERAVPLTHLDPEALLDDLEPLRGIIGDARVVAIGEHSHFIEEFALLRRRILRFLVERCGFTVLAFEYGFSEGFPLDVWAGGEGTDEDLAVHLAQAIPIGLTEPLRWVRRHNHNTSPPVRFAGIDIPAAGGSLLPALAPVADYLRRVDPESVPAVETATRIAASFAGGSAAVAAPAWARLFAGNGLTADTSARDAYMARSVLWHLERLDPGTRIVLAAHNAHIQTTPISFDGHLTGLPMGQQLRRALGDDYFALGLTSIAGHTADMHRDETAPFGFTLVDTALEPPEPGSVEAAFADAALGLGIADLRTARTETPDHPDRIRLQGTYVRTPVIDAFDAVLTTPASTVTTDLRT
ncbi:erythromycin esterase family protein [Streptomyces niveus]